MTNQMQSTPAYFAWLIESTKSEPRKSNGTIEEIMINIGLSRGLRMKVMNINPESQQTDGNISEYIISQVCHLFGFNETHFRRYRGRKGNYVLARYLCFYFMKQYTKLSLKNISKAVSIYPASYDHSTVLHGIGMIKDFIRTKDEGYDFYQKYLLLNAFFSDELMTVSDGK